MPSHTLPRACQDDLLDQALRGWSWALHWLAARFLALIAPGPRCHAASVPRPRNQAAETAAATAKRKRIYPAAAIVSCSRSTSPQLM